MYKKNSNSNFLLNITSCFFFFSNEKLENFFFRKVFLGGNPFWSCLLGEILEFPHGKTSLGLNETTHRPWAQPMLDGRQMQSQSAQP